MKRSHTVEAAGFILLETDYLHNALYAATIAAEGMGVDINVYQHAIERQLVATALPNGDIEHVIV